MTFLTKKKGVACTDTTHKGRRKIDVPTWRQPQHLGVRKGNCMALTSKGSL